MSDFDLLSRVFALLLGLAVCEVFKGFALTWRVMQQAEDAGATHLRIGWLVPLLALLMVFDQTTFWFNFKAVGPHLPVNILVVASMMIMVGAYYALSSFVFPAKPERWPDYDDYYMHVRRTVLGGMLAINFIGLVITGIVALQGAGVGLAAGTPISDVAEFLAIFVVAATLLAKSKRTNIALLVAANILAVVGELPI